VASSQGLDTVPMPPQTALPALAVFDLHPTLRDAVQPPQSADRGAPFLRGWRHGCNAFTFRCPATSLADLVGPFLGRGDCLAPYFLNGDKTWIDPSVEPASGDFVMVSWSDDFFQLLMRKAGQQFLEETGRFPSGFAQKRLQRVDGAWLLTSIASSGAAAGVPLAGNARILGVVRYAERDGRPLYLPKEPRG
jgi:hypothetical protein